MKQKILKSISILTIISILLTFVLMLFLIYTQSHAQMEESVKNEAGYVALAVEESGKSYLTDAVANVTSSRITWIDSDGTVIYDSAEDALELGNHKERPEIQQAQEKGSGKSTRLSATLGTETFYYALRLDDDTVIRVARTTDSVFMNVKNSIVPLFLIFVVVITVAIILIRRETDRLIRPINDLNLDEPLENDVYEEISPLLHRINQQQSQIKAQVAELKEREEEYLTITENMKDGLIVTNQSVVLSINQAALNLFHAQKEECIHKNILNLSRNQKIKQCVDKALRGIPNDDTADLSGKKYRLIANPVVVDHNVEGAVLLILDITQQAKVEQMRREFSANVSHELKTPLMSISGYAELIMNGMVKDGDIQGFAGRIYAEANRLSALVSDIIKLSKLDEGDKNLTKENVDLWSLATDVSWRLQHKAAQRGIQIKVEGEPVQTQGNLQILTEIMDNLCDNAIKYNKENGLVVLGVHKNDKGPLLTVEDTGVGIPAEEQERIFERFYRVDKSHSKEIEGTGLGLSIVKHGVLLHNGTITVDSAPGKGTKISIQL